MVAPTKYPTPRRVRVFALVFGLVFLVTGVYWVGTFIARPVDAGRVLFGVLALVVGLAGLWLAWWSRKPRA
jgi:apolipoprotein N-acyltransferase